MISLLSSTKRRFLAGVAVVFLGSVTFGCSDVAFDPFTETHRHYSMSGYLNARADTQVVRVERLRDSLLFGNTPLNATVTMNHPASGRSWTLRDSLFRLGSGRTVRNFWTTAPVRPTETYRVSVQAPDNRGASATVTLPDTFPAPKVLSHPVCLTPVTRCGGAFRVEITGIDRLAAAQAVYHHGPSTVRIDYLDRARPTDEGFIVELDWREAINRLDNVEAFTCVNFFVAAGGPDWPKADTLTNENAPSYLQPGVWSNVDGGIGFLGGIATMLVDVYPPRDCTVHEERFGRIHAAR